MFTLDQFISIMKGVGGADENVDLDGDIADTALADLGYDSLAVLEMESQVQLRYGIKLPDGTLGTTSTPRQAAEQVSVLTAAEV